MKNRVRKWLIASAVAAIATLGLVPRANAAFTLRLSSDGGSNWTTVTDGGAGDTSGQAGSITFNGSIGNFVVNVTTGISKPILVNTPFSASMDLNSINVSVAGGGSLIVQLSDTDFQLTPSPGNYLLTQNFGGTLSAGSTSSPNSASLQSFVGASNNLFDVSGVTVSKTFTNPGNTGGSFSDDTSLLFPGTSPFSLTQQLTITFGGSGVNSYSGDGFTTVTTPAPASVVLLAMGLPLLGGYSWLRRRKAACAA